MRLARFVALVIVLAAVYFAQYLFDSTNLADFFPAWLLTLWPAIGEMTRWSPDDLLRLAVWLTLLGLLSFGVLAPWWQGEQGRVYRRLPPGRVSLRVWWWASQILFVLALVTAVVAVWLLVEREDQTLTIAMWGVSLVFYGVSGIIANQIRPAVVYGDGYLETVRPWDSWPYWLLILFLFALLYGYRLLSVPLRVDPLSAQVGLAAQAWARDLQLPHLAASPSEMPLPTLALTALAREIFGDNLIALRLAGIVAALFLLSAIWLLGTELFRRVPVHGDFGEVMEDDGRWIALMGMIAAGVSLPLYHWSRSPFMLEGLGVGTLGIWALLRGVRRDRPALMGLSALTIGWSIYYGLVGLVLLIIALFVWCGILLLESKWLTGKQVARQQGGQAVPVQRGVGWRGFGYWLVGIVIVILPLVIHWMTSAGAFGAQWIWPDGAQLSQNASVVSWRDRIVATLLGLNHLADAGASQVYGTHFVQSLLAPLLVLAIGVVALNIDSLVGWTLATWLVTGVVAAALTVSVAPSWTALLVLLPAIALAIAFSLDRIRLYVMSNGGTWTLQATVYLAVGLVLSAGLLSWITYYNVAQRDNDLATSVGRALREAGERPVVIVADNAAKPNASNQSETAQQTLTETLTNPVVQLLASQRQDLTHIQTLDAQNWPSLSPGTRLLLAPGDNTVEMAMEAAYPNGQLTVLRDLRANPLLYVYDLYDTSTMPPNE